jgi:hypothetical protein
MTEKLAAIGVPVSWERVLEIAGDASVGRPHVAQALVEAGHVATVKEAFDRYIGRDGPAYVEREKLSPEDAIRMLCRYEAPPVLAHPTFVKGIEEVLPELKAAGLVGMEVYYKDYDEETQQRLAALAGQFGLLPLGGSDYHGIHGQDEREPGNIPLPSSVARDFIEKELPWVPTGGLD